MTYATQFCDDLRDLINTTVTITARSSINSYGEAQYPGSGTSYPAYVQKISISQRNVTRDDVAVEYRVYILSTTYTPLMTDLVTYASVTRPIVEIDIRTDEFGQQAVVLALGEPRRS